MSESIQIYLNSKNADSYLNGSLSDCIFNLPLIEIPDGFHIYVSIVDCVIPFSFYSINSTNNILVYLYLGTQYTVTIPVGNYNINQLITALQSLMSNFTVSYTSVTNKLTFTNSSNNNFSFLPSSTCFGIIGFSDGNTYTSNAYVLTSVNCINIYSITYIQVNSNFLTYNINKKQINNLNILGLIPIQTTPFSLIQYNNSTNYKINLFINQISSIRIKLTDNLGNLLDLNGCYFNMTLQLDVIKFT